MGAAIHQSELDGLARPVTFDTGALIAIERGDPAIRALARILALERSPILIPSPVVSESWRGGAGRQARLGQFLNAGVERGHLRVIDLSFEVAKEIGMILARAPMSVTDAAVCQCALLARGGVVTSDPTDLRHVIPANRIRTV